MSESSTHQLRTAAYSLPGLTDSPVGGQGVGEEGICQQREVGGGKVCQPLHHNGSGVYILHLDIKEILFNKLSTCI